MTRQLSRLWHPLLYCSVRSRVQHYWKSQTYTRGLRTQPTPQQGAFFWKPIALTPSEDWKVLSQTMTYRAPPELNSNNFFTKITHFSNKNSIRMEVSLDNFANLTSWEASVGLACLDLFLLFVPYFLWRRQRKFQRQCFNSFFGQPWDGLQPFGTVSGTHGAKRLTVSSHA